MSDPIPLLIKIRATKARIQSLRDERGEAQHHLSALRDRVNKTEAKINEIDSDVRLEQMALQELQNDLDELVDEASK